MCVIILGPIVFQGKKYPSNKMIFSLRDILLVLPWPFFLQGGTLEKLSALFHATPLPFFYLSRTVQDYRESPTAQQGLHKLELPRNQTSRIKSDSHTDPHLAQAWKILDPTSGVGCDCSDHLQGTFSWLCRLFRHFFGTPGRQVPFWDFFGILGMEGPALLVTGGSNRKEWTIDPVLFKKRPFVSLAAPPPSTVRGEGAQALSFSTQKTL